MGVAALVLTGGDYAIHGTNRPESVGGFVSYGCIRMYNGDITRLFAAGQRRHAGLRRSLDRQLPCTRGGQAGALPSRTGAAPLSCPGAAIIVPYRPPLSQDLAKVRDPFQSNRKRRRGLRLIEVDAWIDSSLFRAGRVDRRPARGDLALHAPLPGDRLQPAPSSSCSARA